MKKCLLLLSFFVETSMRFPGWGEAIFFFLSEENRKDFKS